LFAVAASAHAQPAQSPQLVRIALHDGRTVDGYITGGDSATIYVQTSYGYFSILRTNIAAVTPYASVPPPLPGPGQVAPMPPPPQPVMQPAMAPPPDPEANETSSATYRIAGIAYFGTSYLVTSIAASAKRDNDETAKLGFIPVAGPVLWAFSKDDDDVGEDGWDWLAIGGSLMQLGGIYWAIDGKSSTKKAKVAVTPVTSHDFAGLVVGGGW
jgi:hypothetical protein